MGATTGDMPRRVDDLVREAIEWHLPADQYRVLEVAEESERQLLRAWAAGKGEAA